ncbi:MAG TPA: aldo/keto reductase [Actinopolymorphaceae bacterium]|jgi:aryl-alcohol dehydrogenase-like predicted oxidoreductase
MRYAELETVSAKKISRIGVGTWQFGAREWGYGSEYEARSHGIVRRALDSGITLFDTAEAYGFGRSERLLGVALGDDRDRAFVATKLFPVLPVSGVVQQRAVASAARLGVHAIDLYQVHQPNPVIRDGTTMAGMRRLQAAGLVRDVGVSNYSLDRWQAAERALGTPVLSNQVSYSIVHREPEDDLIPYARANGRLVIAYSPLSQGWVSGRYTADNPPPGNVRAMNPLFLPANLERGAGLLAVLREVADAHEATTSQIALAYLLRDPAVVAIPGASGEEQVEENAAAGDIVLADDEYAALVGAARGFVPLTGPSTVLPLIRRRLHR